MKIDGINKETEYRFEPYSQLLHRFGWKYVPHPASIISKEVFETLGGFDENYTIAADQKLFLQASKVCFPRVLSKPVSKFHLGGLSSRSVLDSMKDLQLASNEVFGPLFGLQPIDNFFWFANTFAKKIVKKLTFAFY